MDVNNDNFKMVNKIMKKEMHLGLLDLKDTHSIVVRNSGCKHNCS